MIRPVAAFLILYAFWLLLSGHDTPFLLAAGAGSAAAVVAFAHRLRVLDPEGLPIALLPRALPYWGWLLKEIWKSGWTVSRIIVDPRLPISPTLVRFKPGQRTAVGLVIHANSITLTPGTIAVRADAGEFLVHGITRDGAEGCIDSEMDARVCAVEGTRR